MEAGTEAHDLKAGAPGASLDFGPSLTQTPHTGVCSTCGFLPQKTLPLLCCYHLAVLQIPFSSRKPSLTSGEVHHPQL